MPFGVRKAPAASQKLMQKLLRYLMTDEGEVIVDVYLDDIIVLYKPFEDHIFHLEQVFR